MYAVLIAADINPAFSGLGEMVVNSLQKRA